MSTSPRPRSRSLGILTAVLTVALVTGVDAAYAETTRCKATVVRNASKFAQAKANALANCEREIVSGKLPASTD